MHHGTCNRSPAKNRKIQTRRGFSFKNPEVVAYERAFPLFVPAKYRNLKAGGLDEPLAATVTVFYPSRRSDLDCALFYDCLQTAGVIANDRYIVEKHETAKVTPRIHESKSKSGGRGDLLCRQLP